jgi:aminoglycoside phosphotransferase (APT) family kinase protein
MSNIDRQSTYSGTVSVKTEFAFDAARLEEFLSGKLHDFKGPLEVRQFKGGQSNPTYFLHTPARNYVLRRKPPGKLLPSAHAIDREYRVMTALHPQKFPVPKPLLYCEDESIIGTVFYLMEEVAGRVFWEPHMPDSTRAERKDLYDSMNETLARLHSFDPAKLGLADYGKPENYVARQVVRWSKQYEASKTSEIPEMDALIRWLPEHLPPAQPARIVHGDYRIDNLIVAKVGTSIAAVIDWELSTLGDPLADFTYHLMAWEMPEGGGFGSLKGRNLQSLGLPDLDSYVADYARRTGLDPRRCLPLYMAYNFFRIAAIVQGITGRVRDGTAVSETAATRAATVRPLAQAGWKFAQAADG